MVCRNQIKNVCKVMQVMHLCANHVRENVLVDHFAKAAGAHWDGKIAKDSVVRKVMQSENCAPGRRLKNVLVDQLGMLLCTK